MHIEQSAIEVWNLTKQRFEFRRMLALTQTIMEELDEKVAIESVELIFSTLLLQPFQTIGEIIGIAIELPRGLCIQETFTLDKIDEHQAVEHQRGIPLATSL